MNGLRVAVYISSSVLLMVASVMAVGWLFAEACKVVLTVGGWL